MSYKLPEPNPKRPTIKSAAELAEAKAKAATFEKELAELAAGKPKPGIPAGQWMLPAQVDALRVQLLSLQQSISEYEKTPGPQIKYGS